MRRRRYPLLHVIHGGPHSAAGDSWHYRWNTATFAAQGYVVCSVNYHGSSGFGYAFLDSITHRYGQLELQDIEAATDVLLQQPWADPKRVFAAGGSYGGYLVAWMNGHAAHRPLPGLCLPRRLLRLDGDVRRRLLPLACARVRRLVLGRPGQGQRAERAAASSPHMRTPTLVVHGALDYRVPDQQGLAYYNTLKARKVDARLLWFPDENHWVLKPRNSRAVVRRVLRLAEGARPRPAHAQPRLSAGPRASGRFGLRQRRAGAGLRGLDTVAAEPLGAVQRVVGAHQQPRRIFRRSGPFGHADAHRQRASATRRAPAVRAARARRSVSASASARARFDAGSSTTNSSPP